MPRDTIARPQNESAMNKSEYLLLAEALKSARPGAKGPYPEQWEVKAAAWQRLTWEATVEAVADALARQAPAFNRELFLKNAGVTP